MPNAKDNAKMSGDTHLPDVESELPLQQGGTGVGADGTPSARGESEDPGHPGRGQPKGGEIKDRDAETSNSYGNTRDSGEGR